MNLRLKSFFWFYFLFIAAVLLAAELEAASNNSSIPHYTILASTSDIKESVDDAHSYQYALLPNQMRVLLISGANVKKSMAVLSVKAGSASDPKEFPGLAHLIEHVLLRGTKKYPGSEEHVEYYRNNSGSFNGGTTLTQTFYYGFISNEAFLEGLDRLAQLILAPCFSPESIEQEIGRIDEQNLEDSYVPLSMIHYFFQLMCDPNHPFCRFNHGNRKTLKEIPESNGNNVTDALRNFHNQYYSANLIKLVILSNLSIPTMERSVYSLFSPIQNKNTEVPDFLKAPWDAFAPNQISQFIQAEGNSSITVLTLRWYFKNSPELQISNPLTYIQRLLKYQGMGSLCEYWRRQGFASTLVVNLDNSFDPFIAFSLSIVVSKEGIKYMDQVISSIFQFLKVLKDTSFERHEELYNHLKFLDDYIEPYPEFTLNELLELASDLQQTIPPSRYLSFRHPSEKWDPDVFNRTLYAFDTTFQIVLLHAQNSTNKTFNETDPIYGMKYTKSDIPNAISRRIFLVPYTHNTELYFPEMFVSSES